MIVYLNAFNKQLESIKSKFKKSADHITKTIEALEGNPLVGDRMPGYGEFHLRKLRIGLPQYNIGKRGGLRLCFIYKVETGKITPFRIYFKGDKKELKPEKKHMLKHLKACIKELNEGCS